MDTNKRTTIPKPWLKCSPNVEDSWISDKHDIKPIHARQRSLPGQMLSDDCVSAKVSHPSSVLYNSSTMIPQMNGNHDPDEDESYNFVIDIKFRRGSMSKPSNLMSTSLTERGTCEYSADLWPKAKHESMNCSFGTFIGDLTQPATPSPEENIFHGYRGRGSYESLDAHSPSKSKHSPIAKTVGPSPISYSAAKFASNFTGRDYCLVKPAHMYHNAFIEGSRLVGSKSVYLDRHSIPEVHTPRNDVVKLVDLLRSPDQNVVINASACLQHVVFCNPSLKELTRQSGGIQKLVELLYSSNGHICRNAVGALRNLTCGENFDIKDEFILSDGIRAITWLIENRQRIAELRPHSLEHFDNRLSDPRYSDQSEEFQPAIDSAVAILCNLADDDQLKRIVLDQAVIPCLVPHVLRVIACNTILNEKEAKNDLVEPAYISVLFRNVGAILRNLSGSENNDIRESMRQCPDLLWSLISILQAAVKQNGSDTKSVEHCISTLRNLCYFVHLSSDSKSVRSKSISGKFWRKSSGPNHRRPTKTIESILDLPKHLSILAELETNSMLVDLLNASSNPYTIEAAIRTIQNLSSNNSIFGPTARRNFRQLHCLPLLVDLLRAPSKSIATASADALRNLAIEEEACLLLGENAMTRIVYNLEQLTSSFNSSVRTSLDKTTEWKWPESNYDLKAPYRKRSTISRGLCSTAGLIISLLSLCSSIVEKHLNNARKFVTSGGLEVCRKLVTRDELDKLISLDEDASKLEPIRRQTDELLRILLEYNELRPMFKLAGWKRTDFPSKSHQKHSKFAISRRHSLTRTSATYTERGSLLEEAKSSPTNRRFSKTRIWKQRDRLHSTVEDVQRRDDHDERDLLLS